MQLRSGSLSLRATYLILDNKIVLIVLVRGKPECWNWGNAANNESWGFGEHGNGDGNLRMHCRTLGRTGLKVSIIGFGVAVSREHHTVILVRGTRSAASNST